MKHRLMPWLAMAPLLLCAHVAHAGAVAEATVNTLTFTLVDLDSSDGIAPSLSFAGHNEVYSRMSSDWYRDDYIVQRGGNGTRQLSDSVPGQAVSAGVFQAPPAPQPTSLSAHAQGAAFFGNYESLSYATANANAGNSNPFDAFVLSPHTQLIVSGNAYTYAGALHNTSQAVYEYAVGTVQVILSVGDQNQSFLQRSLIGTWDTAEDSKNQMFSLSFSNVSGLSVMGQFGATTDAAVWSEVTAVPEPGSAAMLSLGLLALWGGRRRRSTSSTD